MKGQANLQKHSDTPQLSRKEEKEEEKQEILCISPMRRKPVLGLLVFVEICSFADLYIPSVMFSTLTLYMTDH